MLKKRLFGMLTLIVGVTLVFSLIGCDNGTTGPETQPTVPQSVTYVSEDSNGNLYTLVITEKTNRSARYTAKNGDSFTFTVELFNNDVYSVALTYSGTVESAENSGTEIEIGVTVNGEALTITVSGTTMTVISGTIVLDNEEEITITEPLTPVVDKRALEAAITAANTAKENVIVSINGTDVLTTVYWVSQARMDTFTTAIATAQAVYENVNAEQSMVDYAKITMETATTAFIGYKQLGTKIGNTTTLESGVYASGEYWDGNSQHAGYWHNGNWIMLSTPSGTNSSGAGQIFVSEGNLYISGDYFTETNSHSGYWLNGVWNNLDTSTASGRKSPQGIAVVNSNVYVSGTRYAEPDPNLPFMFTKRYAGYWLNGVWHDLSVPAGANSEVVGICIENTNVYIGGYYFDSNDNMRPCYWKNGERHDFPDSVGRVIVDITVSGGKVYAAELHDGFWIDDNWYFRGDYNGNPRVSKTCIEVIGNNVYLAGTAWSGSNAGYFLNENWTFLAEPVGAQGSSVTSISVSGSNIYFIGYYSDMVGTNACYWKNGILQILPVPSGSLSSTIKSIVVVE